MANGLMQYVKDTQGELRHVAWPTRTQTIVYTVLVAAISVGVALYLGFFDYLFTGTLTRYVGVAPVQTPSVQVSTSSPAGQIVPNQNPPSSTAPNFNLPGGTSQQ